MSILNIVNNDANILKRKRNDFTYEPGYDTDLNCCICMDPLQDAIQHNDKGKNCKVAFCRLCLQDYKNKNKQEHLNCPTCRKQIDFEKDFGEVARPIKNMTDNMIVKCNHCCTTLIRGNLSIHWEK